MPKTNEEILAKIQELISDEDAFSYKMDTDWGYEHVYDDENTQETLRLFAEWLTETEIPLPIEAEKPPVAPGYSFGSNFSGMNSVYIFHTCPIQLPSSTPNPEECDATDGDSKV